MAKKVTKDECPQCYLDGKPGVDLQYRPGSAISHTCASGHSFDDREVLASLMQQVRASKVKPAPVEAKPVPTGGDKTVKMELVDDITGEVVPPKGGIVIDAINIARLTSILGEFSDASSLFGATFALSQNLADTKELLERAEASKQLNQLRKVGNGDAIVNIIIPEAYVQPLTDVAEANGLDMPRYLSSRIEDGLSNFWFF